MVRDRDRSVKPEKSRNAFVREAFPKAPTLGRISSLSMVTLIRAGKVHSHLLKTSMRSKDNGEEGLLHP